MASVEPASLDADKMPFDCAELASSYEAVVNTKHQQDAPFLQLQRGVIIFMMLWELFLSMTITLSVQMFWKMLTVVTATPNK